MKTSYAYHYFKTTMKRWLHTEIKNDRSRWANQMKWRWDDKEHITELIISTHHLNVIKHDSTIHSSILIRKTIWASVWLSPTSDGLQFPLEGFDIIATSDITWQIIIVHSASVGETFLANFKSNVWYQQILSYTWTRFALSVCTSPSEHIHLYRALLNQTLADLQTHMIFPSIAQQRQISHSM